MKEAMLYDRLDSGAVRCRLCRHGCKIEDGKAGICRVRVNQGGTLYSLVYDKVISANVDPIEKKPLSHVAPGSRSFSVATPGCNFQCTFCQNYSISQMPRDAAQISGRAIPPAELVQAAVENRCESIAYTYTEPTVYFELAYDTMLEAKKQGLLNIFVTNGYMSRDALDAAKGLLDAANVDLKAFSDHFYQKYCKAKREGVLDTLKQMKKLGIWLEVTTLLIPTLNDDPAEIRGLARFIRDELGPETPWHVSRFHPDYKETGLPPTDAHALREVRQVGMDEGLHYVYVGNLPWDPGENTHCPECSYLVIERRGYVIRANNLEEGRCPQCHHQVAGLRM